MLSPFHIGSPCGERESFQARILGSYRFISLSVARVPRTTEREGKKRKLWGLRPQTPMKIKNKRFKPSLLSAFREQQGGKGKRGSHGGSAPIRPMKIKNKRFKPSLLSAFREQQGGKGKSSSSLPRTPLGPEGPRPHGLAHRIQDTTQPGQLRIKFTRQCSTRDFVNGPIAHPPTLMIILYHQTPAPNISVIFLCFVAA